MTTKVGSGATWIRSPQNGDTSSICLMSRPPFRSDKYFSPLVSQFILTQWTKLTARKSSIAFDREARQKLIFEDREFTNSQRYFWALQSLRLFGEHVGNTLRMIDDILRMGYRLDDDEETSSDEFEVLRKDCTKEFEGLRDRIERKRQDVQSLRDGVSRQIIRCAGIMLTLYSSSRRRPSSKDGSLVSRMAISVF